MLLACHQTTNSLAAGLACLTLAPRRQLNANETAMITGAMLVLLNSN
jgi:hypothetical protein